jgi:hypothetical protein
LDHTLRRRLIEALKLRSWTALDAERAVAGVAGLYEDGEGEWMVWLSQAAHDPDYCRVARRENEISVYDSLREVRARDVAGALNEIEGHDSDATGTH